MPRLKNNPDAQLAIEHEFLRLTFCGIIIASFFAIFAAGTELKGLLSSGAANTAVILIGLSAAFSFVYLLSVAASVKFQGPRQVDRFPMSVKASHFFYDASINVFGVYVLFVVVAWIDSHFLHLPPSPYFWPLYVALFSAAYFVARVMWAVCQRLIEWQYDYAEKVNHRLEHSRRD